MGVFGQAANPFRGAPEERLGQENSFLGVGPQGAGPPPIGCDTGGAHLSSFLPHTFPRWAHKHLLISNQGGALGMLDQYTGYSDEMLEQMNSVSLIGGELLPFPY